MSANFKAALVTTVIVGGVFGLHLAEPKEAIRAIAGTVLVICICGIWFAAKNLFEINDRDL